MDSILDTDKKTETAIAQPTEVVVEVQTVKSKPRKNCKYCRCERKANVEWYDGDYCSGKCKKLDGGIVEPKALPADVVAQPSYRKTEEIGRLGNLLSTKRKEVTELNAHLDNLMEKKGDLLAAGKDTEANRIEWDAVFAKMKGIEADIILIEEKTIPRKIQEARRLQQHETAATREGLLDAKEEFLDDIQEAFSEINSIVVKWGALIKESGVSLNPKARDLFTETIILDSTRNQLKRRIAGRRVAKCANYPVGDDV